jgi:hypothetical protein
MKPLELALGIFTVAGGLASLLSPPWRPWLLAAAGAALLALVLVVCYQRIWLRRLHDPLPPAADVQEVAAPYRIRIATASDLPWIFQAARTVYHGNDVIPENTMREWFARNPHIIHVVEGPAGNIVGNIDVLPLRPRAWKRFCGGSMLERDLRGDDIFSIKERDRVTVLYVESFVSLSSHGKAIPMAVASTIANFVSITRSVANPERVRSVFALAASSGGSRLLLHLGFTRVCDARTRTDGHHMYGVHFPTLAANIAEKLGDKVRSKHTAALLARLPSARTL